ncbi:LamG domain-containing protein [Streptomyces sp. HMX87]|uniref:LamG domain-containing protein n=1 Tax=Streptomyces sp. HMX87 TaxID=3390849 RepID=UPI003A83D380
MAAAALTVPATTAQAAPERHAGQGRQTASAPLPPRITLSEPYTACLAEACPGRGGPGTAVTFTFTPGEPDTDIASYEYRLSSGPSWSSVSGSIASVTYIPQQPGLHRLRVRAVDEAGRPGTTAVLDFKVAAGETPTGRWHFDEATGPALDSGTATGAPRHDAALSDGATRDDRGRRGVLTHDSQGARLNQSVTDRGLTLDGTSGHATTTDSVIDSSTSYTLSIWVRPDRLGAADQAVLAQGGPRGFRLFYEGARGTWALRTAAPGEAEHRTLTAQQPASPQVWTHLAAVYDAPADEARLYVNGRLQATGTAAAPGESDGPLQFGRAPLRSASGEYGDHFGGTLDEAAVWRRPLTDTEIADEARLVVNGAYNAVEPVAVWSADGASGTTLPDTTSGYGHTLTLSGGTAPDGEEFLFDGVDDAAVANGPLVDDTGSFTVSTEVTLDGAALAEKEPGYVGMVLGRRSADGSTWGLWYEATGWTTVLDPETFEEKLVPVGLWRFGRLNTDGTYEAVSSEEAARTDTPVRLTAVHDAQDGTIALYIGSVRNGDARPFAAAPGSGAFTVGAATNGETRTHHLPARVKIVRVWDGAMASAQQVDEIDGA